MLWMHTGHANLLRNNCPTGSALCLALSLPQLPPPLPLSLHLSGRLGKANQRQAGLIWRAEMKRPIHLAAAFETSN